ncbi:methionine synthase [Actinomarinicola tropica]|uniref:Methionine synthase n=1 Tax=Actinomarinicola tropica TaxID=2789776 RepID=A0A5Q2RGD5_9ACTN|nr:methionine synthase [Actinomarinicola tropica]QGG95868.1 methionine synthase [Actinomarinicola tropica]
MRYLDAVHGEVLVYDGAFGTYMQTKDLTADDFGGPELEGCNEMLVLTRPDLVAEMHHAFLDVGVDVIETATFGAFSIPLNEYALGDRAHEINVAAARIARAAADEVSTPDHPRFVAGSIGPGTKMPTLGHIPFAELRDAYEVQCRGLLEGGVDVLLIETQYDLLGAKAAIIAARRAMADTGVEVPLQVQVTIEQTGRMLVGTEIGAALTALDAMRVDVIGLNCATGPAEMSEHIRHLSQHSRVPIAVLPNAGLPSVIDGKMHYDLTPEQLADFHERFVTELGVQIVGGCCGTTPAHLAAVVDRLRDVRPADRRPVHDPGVASIYSHTPYDQSPSFLVVGERTNANGSKKFREALLAADWDTATKMASDQVREGSHVIDVCVDYVGRDGVADMQEIASRFATASTVPIMVDSTEADVVETALQWIGGKAILNSVNLEDGAEPGTRLDRFLALARDYGAAVVCTTIDEVGQARDREWKLRAAKAIYDLATERYGIPPEDLIFDPLALTLATGMEESRKDGIETIEGIRLIKSELPGVHTILGLSNISFGLKPAARHVLNSVFLHECQEAGLDAAIVHAARIMPLAKIPEEQVQVCLDLIHDRRREGYDPLEALLDMFEGVSAAEVVKEDRSGWTVQERLKARIIDGDRDGLTVELDEALGAGIPALGIVNDVLLEGMKVVGERFGAGEMQLPFVLQSAETMKAAVAHLEPHMEKVEGEGSGKGRIVLATVAGDVHDIGKNLVDIILTNNGYEVHNLGIKVSIGDMVATAQQIQADAIGMSGLLVKSTLIMRDNLEELNERGLSDIPVLLGGAALTRTYVERDLRDIYDGRLFYGKDAFEGLRVMDRLGEIRRGDDDPDFGRVLGGRNIPARTKVEVDPATIPARSPEAQLDNPVFTPPFTGSQVVKGIALDDIAEYVNETALFRNQWQFRPESGENDDEFKARIRPTFRALLAEAKAEGILVPQVVYGYFPANSDGNEIVIWTDESRTVERTRFAYPRQQVEPWLCIADFVRPIGSEDPDHVAFHIVTMGATVSERTAELFAADKYQDYLFLHGLGVEMAEALAEMWHRRIREEWGFADEDGPTLQGLFRQQYRGGRYSWGYPACPELEDNARVAELLDAERIGVEVSAETGFQYQPEQTTSAIILHHPRAKYFVAR